VNLHKANLTDVFIVCRRGEVLTRRSIEMRLKSHFRSGYH